MAYSGFTFRQGSLQNVKFGIPFITNILLFQRKLSMNIMFSKAHFPYCIKYVCVSADKLYKFNSIFF